MMKQKGYEVMMSIAQERKAIRQQALAVFKLNLAKLLAEKGWNEYSNLKLTAVFNCYSNGRDFGEHMFRMWRRGTGLPSYANFLKLVDVLDCYEEDLLPEKYQGILRGY